MRNTLIIIGVVLAILLAGAWFYLTSMDAQVEVSIEKYGTDIMGVPVSLTEVKIAAQSGEGKITDLVVSNPTGFSIPAAFSALQTQISLDVHSLSSDVVLIHSINIVAPDVYVEQNTAGNNIRMIKESVHAFLLAHSAAPGTTLTPEQVAANGKRFIIESFTMQGARLHAHAPLVQAEVVTVPLADIQLNGIGKDNGGMLAAEVLDIIMQQLSAHINQAVVARNLQNMIEVDKSAEDPGIVDRIREFLTF